MPDPFTLEEVEQILSCLKDEPVFHNYFELAFFTGLRTSELIALEWSDVDFNRAVLRVNKAYVLGNTKGTKTHSYRDIELNTRAESALKRQRLLTGLKGGLIFLNPTTGCQFENDKTAWRPWHRAVMLSGVRYRKPYNTRHTFATLNLMAGANPMWVARQLGHTSMKMLLENYSRWIDLADKQREKAKIESLFCVVLCFFVTYLYYWETLKLRRRRAKMSEPVITPVAVYAFSGSVAAGYLLGMPVDAVALGAIASAAVTMISNPASRWLAVSYTIIGGLLGGAFAPPLVHVLIGEAGKNYPALIEQKTAFTNVFAPVLIGLLWQVCLKVLKALYPAFERRADDIMDWLINLLPWRFKK